MACLTINNKYVFDVRRFPIWDSLKRPFHHPGDTREIDPALQEGFDRHLVRGIKNARGRSSGSLRFVSQTEERKFVVIRG